MGPSQSADGVSRSSRRYMLFSSQCHTQGLTRLCLSVSACAVFVCGLCEDQWSSIVCLYACVCACVRSSEAHLCVCVCLCRPVKLINRRRADV